LPVEWDGCEWEPFGCRDGVGPKGHSFGTTPEPNHLVTPRVHTKLWLVGSECALGPTRSSQANDSVLNWPTVCQLKGGKSESCHLLPGLGGGKRPSPADSYLHAPGIISLGLEVLHPPPSSSTSVSAKSHSIGINFKGSL